MSHKRYEKIDIIGEGQFATVWKARDKQTDRIVAIKKIKLGDRYEAADGVNRTALREIKLLREVQHENVIALLDVFGKESSISLVFDIMVADLEQIIHDRDIPLSLAHTKSYLLMTLKGIEFLHQNFILHRDLKPNNLLLDKNNVLKIADFGLSRTFGSPSRIYSHQVVTIWYRAPELLMGAKMYGAGIDIWAIGCILAELFTREPLFPGTGEIDTLGKITSVLGTIDAQNWPGATELSSYMHFNEDGPVRPLSERFGAVSQDGIDILEAMLRLDPNARCSATEALQMAYFSSQPYPTAPSKLPRLKEKRDTGEEEENASALDGNHLDSKVGRNNGRMGDDSENSSEGDDEDDDEDDEELRGDGAGGAGFKSDQSSVGSLDTKFNIKLEPSEPPADARPTRAKRLKFE